MDKSPMDYKVRSAWGVSRLGPGARLDLTTTELLTSPIFDPGPLTGRARHTAPRRASVNS
jgi:hypothetical protein